MRGDYIFMLVTGILILIASTVLLFFAKKDTKRACVTFAVIALVVLAVFLGCSIGGVCQECYSVEERREAMSNFCDDYHYYLSIWTKYDNQAKIYVDLSNDKELHYTGPYNFNIEINSGCLSYPYAFEKCEQNFREYFKNQYASFLFNCNISYFYDTYLGLDGSYGEIISYWGNQFYILDLGLAYKWKDNFSYEYYPPFLYYNELSQYINESKNNIWLIDNANENGTLKFYSTNLITPTEKTALIFIITFVGLAMVLNILIIVQCFIRNPKKKILTKINVEQLQKESNNGKPSWQMIADSVKDCYIEQACEFLMKNQLSIISNLPSIVANRNESAIAYKRYSIDEFSYSEKEFITETAIKMYYNKPINADEVKEVRLDLDCLGEKEKDRYLEKEIEYLFDVQLKTQKARELLSDEQLMRNKKAFEYNEFLYESLTDVEKDIIEKQRENFINNELLIVKGMFISSVFWDADMEKRSKYYNQAIKYLFEHELENDYLSISEEEIALKKSAIEYNEFYFDELQKDEQKAVTGIAYYLYMNDRELALEAFNELVWERYTEEDKEVYINQGIRVLYETQMKNEDIKNTLTREQRALRLKCIASNKFSIDDLNEEEKELVQEGAFKIFAGTIGEKDSVSSAYFTEEKSSNYNTNKVEGRIEKEVSADNNVIIPTPYKSKKNKELYKHSRRWKLGIARIVCFILIGIGAVLALISGFVEEASNVLSIIYIILVCPSLIAIFILSGLMKECCPVCGTRAIQLSEEKYDRTYSMKDGQLERTDTTRHLVQCPRCKKAWYLFMKMRYKE